VSILSSKSYFRRNEARSQWSNQTTKTVQQRTRKEAIKEALSTLIQHRRYIVDIPSINIIYFSFSTEIFSVPTKKREPEKQMQREPCILNLFLEREEAHLRK
jgi:hypothetical protein